MSNKSEAEKIGEFLTNEANAFLAGRSSPTMHECSIVIPSLAVDGVRPAFRVLIEPNDAPTARAIQAAHRAQNPAGQAMLDTPKSSAKVAKS